MVVLNALHVMVGLGVAGGAIVDLAGRRFSTRNQANWKSMKNDLIIAMDLAWGFGILILALNRPIFFADALYYWIAIMLLVSHLYREWEIRTGFKNTYCADEGMRRFNRIKAIGVAAALLASITVMLA